MRPDNAAVHEALDRMFAVPPFVKAARQRLFLAYVVDEVLAGRGETIKEWSVARAALGEETGFDPRVDSTVRVLAGRVRISLARYYEGPGADQQLRIEMPKGGYVPQFRLVDTVDHELTSPAGNSYGPTVAVMAFRDLTPDAHPDYTAFGFTESLVGALARQAGGPIIGPLVKERPEAGIDQQVVQARAIDADLLLTGSVRTVAGVTRLEVHLTDVSTAGVRWSDTFEARSAPGAPFDAEDRIVERVSGLLADPLGVIQRVGPLTPRTSDPAVYQAMLAYYDYGRTLDQAREPQVLRALEAAHRREPENWLVAAMLGATTMFHGVGDVGGRPPSREDIARAVQLARESDRAFPGNPLAGLVLAFDRLLEGDSLACRTSLQSILRSPSLSPTFRSMCGIGLLLSGAWQEGIDHLRDALALNPGHPRWQHGFLALDSLVRSDLDDALAEARMVETPGLVWGPLLRAAALSASGRVDAAKVELMAIDVNAMAAGMDDNQFLSHTRLPGDVVEALWTALAPALSD